MKIISIKSLKIPEVKVVKFARFTDHRGYFTETYRTSDFLGDSKIKNIFKKTPIAQINESYSKKNVVRGLHFQWNPLMGKLVRAITGSLTDFALDIRIGSSTYGKIIGHELSSTSGAKEGEWIWVPPGFAHGIFCKKRSTIEYLCTGDYSPGCEAGISPLSDDIDWSLCDKKLKKEFLTQKNLIISDKDKEGLTLTEWSKDKRSKNFLYKKLN